MDSQLESLQSAKEVVQWMGIGVLPSQANAMLARDALSNAQAPQARVVLAAIAMGVSPRVELCREAVCEIDEAIDQAREVSGAQLRERFERG